MNAIIRACPDIGAWRAWLDQEERSPHLADHLTTCAGCQRLVDDLREDATDVRDAFALLAPTSLPTPAETALARERVEWRRRRPIPAPVVAGAQEPTPMSLTQISTRWRVAASGLAAAFALSLLIAFTPQGQTAAAAFLAQFRSQSVTAVEVSPQTQSEIMKTLNALGNLGTVKMPGVNGQPRPEAAVRSATEQAKTMTVAEATSAVGFALATPDRATLPAGLDQTPRIQVTPGQQVRFTIEKAKADAYLKSSGRNNVTVPSKLDGATLVVSIPTAALLQYGNANTRDALIIGQSGELVVDVEGNNVTLEEMRDWLLTVVPANVATQLKGIKNWNDTLPIPVPIDKVNWQQTTFQGSSGLLLNDNTGVGSAAIWHANGHLYGMAGSLKATDLQRIANGMQVTH